jgi:NADPH:quinone reductase
MFIGKAWRAPSFGAPQEVLRLTDTVWEPPAVGRILVKVSACGVGFPDANATF